MTIYFIKSNHLSGNECLVGADGHGVGTHIVLNSGCMSHSTPLTPNGGLSKSMMMSFVLMVAPLEYEKQMNFGKAYYLVDISDLEDRHIEVVTILQRACKRFFWVSKGWFGLIRVRVTYLFWIGVSYQKLI